MSQRDNMLSELISFNVEIEWTKRGVLQNFAMKRLEKFCEEAKAGFQTMIESKVKIIRHNLGREKAK